MNFEEAITRIKSFWSESQFPFGANHRAEVSRLEKEFDIEFPAPLRTYLASYAPAFGFAFETVGNPIDLYSPRNMSSRPEGYNWNPITAEKIDDWLPTWFLIGDEGADPIIVDLTNPDGSCPVLQAIHGTGSWDFSLVAPSIPLYLVLVSAQHHALTGFADRRSVITDDENGFNLAEPVAGWYFPFLKEFVPDLYERWTESFDNA